MTTSNGWQVVTAFAALITGYCFIVAMGGDPDSYLRLMSIIGAIVGSSGVLGKKLGKIQNEAIEAKETAKAVAETTNRVAAQTNGNLDIRMSRIVHEVLDERQNRPGSVPATQPGPPD